MKRKWFVVSGVIVLILLLAAAALGIAYLGPAEIGSTEQSAYQIQYRQIGQKMLVTLEKDSDPAYSWRFVQSEPENAVKELRESRHTNRYLINVGESMSGTAEFRMENREANVRYLLRLEFARDGDGKLLFLHPVEISLSGSVSGGTEGILPYTCVGQEDGSLRIYFDLDTDTEWDWAYSADDGVSVAGPDSSPIGFLFYLKPQEVGEHEAEIGLINSQALKLTVEVTKSEQTHLLKADVVHMEITECDLENVHLQEEREEFEKYFGAVGLPEQADIRHYALKRWYVTRKEDNVGVAGGEIEFRMESLPDCKWLLYLSDEASLHGFQLEFEPWYSDTESILCGGREATLYRDNGYLAAIWSIGNRVFALECAGVDENGEQAFLSGLAAIIEAN